MKDIRLLVSEYREKTVNMLKAIEQEEYDKLNLLLEERQKILDIFKENPEYYDRNQIAQGFMEKDILVLDEKVNDLAKKNFLIVKEKLQSINSEMIIKKKYNQGFSGNSLFFNKKVY
jgi:hypothetical protein